MKSSIIMFEAKLVHFHRSAFLFVHLRRSPDCPSLKKLSSLFESKVSNTYVDKGSSNIAHKSFSAADANFFTSNFRYLNIQKATVFEKFSNPWKRCLWVRANNLQRVFTIQVLNPRSKQSSVESRFRSKQTLEKINLEAKVCERQKSNLESKCVTKKILIFIKLFPSETQGKIFWRKNLRGNLDAIKVSREILIKLLIFNQTEEKNLVCKVPLLALPWSF